VAKWQFTKGLHDLGNGCWAYLQPDGGWGWSNAGLIVDGDETLLVDTLFDLPLTAEMLATMRDAVPAAANIGTLLNTHANGDHCNGNQLVEGARIIATAGAAHAMTEERPERLIGMLAAADRDSPGGQLMHEAFGPFDFTGIRLTPVDETFERELTLNVGDKTVRVIDVGPAHTGSDSLVFVEGQRTVYTGDILFSGGQPAIWAGPIGNWVRACDVILDADVETIVPGHGPISTKAEVADFRDYLVFLRDEARARYDAGMTFDQAAFDIDLGRFDHWREPERIVTNMMTLWGEFSGTRPVMESRDTWNLMARARREQQARHADCPHCAGAHA
jgi:glyoxylase-like metal-dependent hydrolase (beta-lactamase superfamily II)